MNWYYLFSCYSFFNDQGDCDLSNCLYKCTNENQHQKERNNALLVHLRSYVVYEAKGHGYNDPCLFYQNKFKKKNDDHILFTASFLFYCQHFFECAQNSFPSGFFSLWYSM